MNGGRIEQIGTPQEVFHQPASEFVMHFLGNVNVFHGRLEGGTLRAIPFATQQGMIGASLTGAGELTKRENGTVVLAAANSYTGGTVAECLGALLHLAFWMLGDRPTI